MVKPSPFPPFPLFLLTRTALWLQTLLLLTGGILSTFAAEADYQAWAQGRPAEALAGLEQQAFSDTERWDYWYDLGLAAAEAGQEGKAIAWLLQARERAPHEEDIHTALTALQVQLPTQWTDTLGPLAWPGMGIYGIILLFIAGLLLGAAVCISKRRGLSILTGSFLLALVLPGVIAQTRDASISYRSIVQDTHLLDSTGHPITPLRTGSILIQERELPGGRLLVQLPQGQRGFVEGADCTARAK